MDQTAPAQSDALRNLHFEFKGSGAEYFRIWIVNLLLTIVTLGIYSAWAKVRTNRYMLANSWVDGHNFDYHAQPLRILIGRLIVLLFVVATSAAQQFAPKVSFAIMAFFFVAAPWLINSGLRFRARNTSYRNVRFNFAGKYWGAFKVFYLWTLLGIVTLGLCMPLVRRAWDYYVIRNHRFGGKPFSITYSGGAIYWIFIAAGLIGLVAGAAGGSVAVGMTMGIPNLPPQAIEIIPVIAAFPVYLYLITFVQTRIFKLVMNNTVIDGKHRLSSDQSTITTFWIFATNLLLMIVTLGLYYPWARVRMRRYQLAHLTLSAATNLDEFASEAIATQGAIGEEFASFFDFDIGL